MTIVLQNETADKNDKIRIAIATLGDPEFKPAITTDNRVVVRSLLNGLGFPSSVYKDASLEALQTAYASLTHTGNGLGLIPFLDAISGPLGDEDTAANISEASRRASSGLHECGFNLVYPIKAGDVTVYRAAHPVTPAKSAPVHSEEALKAMSTLISALSKPADPIISESRIIELIRENVRPTSITINAEVPRTVPVGLHHERLPDVIRMLSSGVNVMMVGPAGSGKTTLADQAAKALEIPFFYNGALSSEHKLSGFVDAQGRIVSTAFPRAFETGGLYLFDEIDASMPDALLAFNAALSNGHADFPDGCMPMHKDFKCMAAANTFGRGADRLYVGRNQLDGASLDRFCVLNIDYDEKLERTLAANDNWTDYVQKIRRAVWSLKIRHIVSPRASIYGAKLLAAGMERQFVEDVAVWKGLDADSVSKIKAKA